MKEKSLRARFQDLKRFSFVNTTVQLWIIKEYKRDHRSHYNIKSVGIDDKLIVRLRGIVKSSLDRANSFEELQLDSPENEPDQIRGIAYEETDYFQIHSKLVTLQPEESQISDVEDLTAAKAYLIVIRNSSGIGLTGYKILPENWKLKKQRGLIPLLFKENRFQDLDENNVFSISSTLDFVFFEDGLFVLSKRNFEQGMNFRDGMLAKSASFYENVMSLGVLTSVDELKARVGDNQRYLRKIATIENLQLYRMPDYIKKLKEVAARRNWPIQFHGDKIVVTEDTIDLILTVLQNKRLHSELTDEIFDVDSARRVET